MKQTVIKIIRLFVGLFLYAAGIVMTINARLGLAPWDVFHQGISNITHITMGQASIALGVVIVILNSVLGEKLGWGTLCNMLFIGLFVDLLMLNYLIPTFQGIIPRIVMMVLGMFTIGVATFLYIGACLGSGPRDGLMVVLKKRTDKSVRFVRNAIEITAVTIGYILGGSVGVGTVIIASTIGYFVQFAFKIFRFDVSKVEHRFIDEDVKLIIKRLSGIKENMDLR